MRQMIYCSQGGARRAQVFLDRVVAFDRLGICRVMRIWDITVILAMSVAWGSGVRATYSQDVLPSQPDFYSGSFQSETYIRIAAELQALGRDAAELRLHEIARDKHSPGRAIILCRMLFKKWPAEEFRRPYVGGALFIGGTGYSDWPLEPIELVDGVPFLITRGYALAGKAESDDQYLSYCETHTDWTDLQYTVRTKQQEHAALAKLVTSPKWKTPLSDEEHQFLARQIE
jgi:hypothetical protein